MKTLLKTKDWPQRTLAGGGRLLHIRGKAFDVISYLLTAKTAERKSVADGQERDF
jgi:hypothetical protein